MKKRRIYYTEATAAELEDFNSNPKTNIKLRFRSVKELDAYEDSQRLEPKRKVHPKKPSPRKRDAP